MFLMNVDDDNCGLGPDKAHIETMMRIKNINNGNRTQEEVIAGRGAGI